jgi:tryptophanyl-tRNA synthetase
MRVLSGMQPSGTLHIGNYLGALKQWVEAQSADAFYCVVDLHALTLEIEPATLRRQSYELIATYMAAGLDPNVCSIFLQSEVPYHAQINWILECVATYGELSRMTQFKEKSSRKTGYRVGLLTYPVLMAGDILLYETPDVRGARGRPTQCRRARDGPSRTDAQDVKVDLESHGLDLRHGPAR